MQLKRILSALRMSGAAALFVVMGACKTFGEYAEGAPDTGGRENARIDGDIDMEASERDTDKTDTGRDGSRADGTSGGADVDGGLEAQMDGAEPRPIDGSDDGGLTARALEAGLGEGATSDGTTEADGGSLSGVGREGGLGGVEVPYTPECFSEAEGLFPFIQLPSASTVGLAATQSYGGGFTMFAAKALSDTIGVSWTSDWTASSWTQWGCFDGFVSPRRVVATTLSNDAYEVFATSARGGLYVRRYFLPTAFWGSWAVFDLPYPDSVISDIALSRPWDGSNHLYVVDRGSIFIRYKNGTDPYGPYGAWQEVGPGAGAVVAAGVRSDGLQQIFSVDADGRPQTRVQKFAGSDAPFDAWSDFGSDELPKVVDLEAPYGLLGALPVFAVDAAGTMWAREQTSDGSFGPWKTLTIPQPAPFATVVSAGLANSPGSPMLLVAISLTGIIYASERASVIDSDSGPKKADPIDIGWQPWRQVP